MISPQFLQSCQSGDEDAIQSLVRTYQRGVFQLALSILDDADLTPTDTPAAVSAAVETASYEAETATRETFSYAIDHLGRYREDTPFETWLYAIAIQITRRRARRWRTRRWFAHLFHNLTGDFFSHLFGWIARRVIAPLRAAFARLGSGLRGLGKAIRGLRPAKPAPKKKVTVDPYAAFKRPANAPAPGVPAPTPPETAQTVTPVSPPIPRVVDNRGVVPSISAAVPAPHPAGPERPVMHADPRLTPADAELWRAVRSLDEHLRLPVVLRYYHDFPIPEIARLLHVSEGAVHARLDSAREHIARSVEAKETKPAEEKEQEPVNGKQ